MTAELDLPKEALDVNLYGILDLPLPTRQNPVTRAQIKHAYRTTVLGHHPDKQALKSQSTSSQSNRHSVDIIQLARSILLSPSLRYQYDAEFLVARQGYASKDKANLSRLAVVETLDLDEMTYIHQTNAYSWPCRCGSSPAYEVTEDALLETPLDESGQGELVVACGGCSLYKRIVFEDAEGG